MFSVFEFLCFLQKKKMSAKYDAEKSSENEPQGVPKLTQNGSELTEKITKTPKFASKSLFLRDRFFDDFWKVKKAFLGAPGD